MRALFWSRRAPGRKLVLESVCPAECVTLLLLQLGAGISQKPELGTHLQMVSIHFGRWEVVVSERNEQIVWKSNILKHFAWKPSERGVCGSLEVGCTGLRSVGDKHHAKGCAGQQTGVVSTPKSLLHITRDRRLLRFKCSLPPGSMKISLTFSGSRVLSKVVQVCRFWKFPWKNPTMCLVCDCFPLVDSLYGTGPLCCVSCSQSHCCAIASVRSGCCKQRNKQKITF